VCVVGGRRLITRLLFWGGVVDFLDNQLQKSVANNTHNGYKAVESYCNSKRKICCSGQNEQGEDIVHDYPV
jgi:hypothetical protein